MTTNRLYQSRTLVIPDKNYSNPYIIFYDLNTGNMFNATTGAVETTWASAAVSGAKHATNKMVLLFTTPPIALDVNIGVNLFQNAAPADTDVITIAQKYDPKNNTTYTDTIPAAQGKTLTR